MFGALVFLLVLALASMRRAKASLRTVSRCTWQAIASFLSYNEHETKAPGVYRSAAGGIRWRLYTFAAALALFALVLVPATSYFPAFSLLTPISLWTDAARVPGFGQMFTEPQAPPMPSRQQVRENLTDEQRAYMERNARTAQERNDYLDYLAREAVKRSAPPGSSRTARQEVQRLAATPEGWFTMSLKGLATGNLVFLFALITSLVLSTAVPAATLFFVVAFVGGPLFVPLYEAYETRDRRSVGLPTGGSPSWETYVESLQSATQADDGREENIPRDHLWLGRSVLNDYPVLLNRRILHDHAWFLGNSGAGKTSLGLAPIITQLQRLSRNLYAEEEARRKERPNEDPRRPDDIPPSILILDLKGEPYMFSGTRREAERAMFAGFQREAELGKMPFRWFTTRKGDSTYTFNPFLQESMKSRTADQKTATILNSLGLEYGEGYGHAHYSEAHAVVLKRVFETEPEIYSFKHLDEILSDPAKLKNQLEISARMRQDAGDVFSLVRSLAKVEALNIVPPTLRDPTLPLPEGMNRKDPAFRRLLEERGERDQRLHDNRLDMRDLVNSSPPQVTYFYLPASLGEATVRRIGRLVLYSLLEAASDYERDRGHPPCVYTVVDEFQQIVSQNLELFLRQARSKGLALLLSNQAQSDLIVNRDDMRATVQANTRFKQFFAAGDPDLRRAIIEGSGTVFGPDWQQVDRGHDRAPTWEPGERTPFNREETRITINDILDVSDDDFRSIVHITRGRGYTQFGGRPVIVESEYHITRDEYDERKAANWPPLNPHTIEAGDEEFAGAPAPQQKARGAVPERHQAFVDDYRTRSKGDAK